MTQHYDVIVIGGGHNGLVNAAYLAKAGKKVLVLERRHVLGGAAVTEEIIPGFLFSECSYVVSLLRPEIIRELDLPRHGLEILPLDGTFSPMPDGNHLWRMNDHAKSIREIRRHSRVDAEAYDEFSKMMTPMCRFVKPMLSMVPPDPTTLNPRDLKQLHFLMQRFRELSSDERYTLIQLMTMSSADFLDQWFETDVLKATMSASGIIGTFLGIRSPGTAYVLLHHYMGEIDGAFRSWGFSRGGTGAISNAIAAAAREAGVEIRTKAPVGKILVKEGRAAGVVLQSGEEITANVISSSVDPHLTFEKFLEPSELPADFLEGVRRYKFRGSSGKVNIALDALPEFKSLPGDGAHLRGAISISPSMEYMERAYDDAKYGHYSRRPYSQLDRSERRASGEACSLLFRAIRTLQACGRHVGPAARSVWRQCGRHDLRICAQPKKYYRRASDSHAARPGTRIRSDARKYFSGRTFAGAIIFSAPGGRLGLLPHSSRQSLYVRFCNASGRRHHGRQRTHRQPGHSQGMEKARRAAPDKKWGKKWRADFN